MVIIFAVAGDRLAADVSDCLAERGMKSLLIAPPGPSSPFRLRWELPAPAPAHVEFNGQRLDMEDISGVILRAQPERPHDTSGESDADYIRTEWRAAMLGWLQAVPAPVVNRPRPGRNLSFPTLYAHAAAFGRAGLHLARVLVTDSESEAGRFYRSCGGSVLVASGCAGPPAPVEDEEDLPGGVCCLIGVPDGVRRRIHVVGGQALTEMSGEGHSPFGPLAESCCKLTRLLGLDFLELEVVSGAKGDVVIGASDLPDAVFREGAYRSRVAAVLSGMLAGERREARP